MRYESEFTPTFLKLLRKLDKPIKERVVKAVEEILGKALSSCLQNRSASNGGLVIIE